MGSWNGLSLLGSSFLQLWGCPASAVAVAGIDDGVCRLVRSSGRFSFPVRDSSLTLLCSPVVTTLRVCLPLAPALRQVLEAVLAEGALELPSILVLAFHLSLSFVEGLSDGLATSVRALLGGCVSLASFVLSSVASARAHSSGWLFLLLWA